MRTSISIVFFRWQKSFYLFKDELSIFPNVLYELNLVGFKENKVYLPFRIISFSFGSFIMKIVLTAEGIFTIITLTNFWARVGLVRILIILKLTLATAYVLMDTMITPILQRLIKKLFWLTVVWLWFIGSKNSRVLIDFWLTVSILFYDILVMSLQQKLNKNRPKTKVTSLATLYAIFFFILWAVP